MVVEFNAPDNTPKIYEAPKKVIQFQNTANPEDTFQAVVTDKYPQMGDVHVEGRHSIEVSVEFFIQLLAAQGYAPVDPRGNEGDN